MKSGKIKVTNLGRSKASIEIILPKDKSESGREDLFYKEIKKYLMSSDIQWTEPDGASPGRIFSGFHSVGEYVYE